MTKAIIHSKIFICSQNRYCITCNNKHYMYAQDSPFTDGGRDGHMVDALEISENIIEHISGIALSKHKSIFYT